MKDNLKVLLIDDNAERRNNIKIILDFVGEETLSAEINNWEAAAEGVDEHKIVAAVACDTTNTNQLNTQLMALVDYDTEMPIILLTENTVKDQLDEKVAKAVVYELNPTLSYSKLLDSLHCAEVYHAQNDAGRSIKRESHLFRSLVGTSRAVCQVRELMGQVSEKDVNVLVTGESGTGKEVIARNLHYQSHRRHKPFIPVNCGAIPSELLESELFGHEKGAFTGAVSSRPGRFEMAQGGTLFLDEIGDMPLHMQVKILRVLQERTFERVGGTKTLNADVRIIAATHKDLEIATQDGSFREDLYYRLNVFPIEIAPLRERTEDIPVIINELVLRIETEKRGSIRFSSTAMMALCRHEWLGNVRELANLVERLIITHSNAVVDVMDLPKRFRHLDEEEGMSALEVGVSIDQESAHHGLRAENVALLPVTGLDLKDYLGTLESTLIRQALDDCNGVVARAAEKLRIRRTTLVEKMRKYKLNRQDVSPNL